MHMIMNNNNIRMEHWYQKSETERMFFSTRWIFFSNTAEASPQALGSKSSHWTSTIYPLVMTNSYGELEKPSIF